MAEDNVVILTADELQSAQGAGDTAQEGPDPWTPGEAIEPPEDLFRLMQLTAQNPTRRPIIDAISLNTVGLGYEIVPRSGYEDQVDSTEAGIIREQLDNLAERDVVLDNPDLAEQLQAVKHDEEGCGNGALEVSRNRLTGQIDGLYHLPGHLVRRRKDRKGWIIGQRHVASPSEWTRYYNFGDKVQYDENGRATNRLKPGRVWATNEIIRLRLYSAESRDYGLPRDVALAADYAGDKLAAEANIGFFEHGGTSPGILFVEGVETEQGGRTTFRVPQKTVKRIKQTMQSGPGLNSRVAIVAVPPGASANYVQLGQTSERDMAFTDYRADNRERQAGAFRISMIFISTQESGQYDAEVERSITLEQLFDPEQRRYERRMNKVLRDLGHVAWQFRFKRLAVEGDAAKRDSADRMAETGNITIGEYRAAHGYPPLPESERPDLDHGVFPTGTNKQLVDIGVPDGAQNRDPFNDQRGQDTGLGGRTQAPEDIGKAVRQVLDDDQDATPEAIGKAVSAVIVKHGGNGHDPEAPEYIEELVQDLRDEVAELMAPGDDPAEPAK